MAKKKAPTPLAFDTDVAVEPDDWASASDKAAWIAKSPAPTVIAHPTPPPSPPESIVEPGAPGDDDEKRVNLFARVTPAMHTAFKIKCIQQGKTTRSVIIELVERYLAEK